MVLYDLFSFCDLVFLYPHYIHVVLILLRFRTITVSFLSLDHQIYLFFLHKLEKRVLLILMSMKNCFVLNLKRVKKNYDNIALLYNGIFFIYIELNVFLNITCLCIVVCFWMMLKIFNFLNQDKYKVSVFSEIDTSTGALVIFSR